MRAIALVWLAGCGQGPGGRDDTGLDLGPPCEEEPCSVDLAAAAVAEPGPSDWGGQNLVIHEDTLFVGAPGRGAENGTAVSHVTAFEVSDLAVRGRWLGTTDYDNTGAAMTVGDMDSDGVAELVVGRISAAEGPPGTTSAVHLLLGSPVGDLPIVDEAVLSVYAPKYINLSTPVIADLDLSGRAEIIAGGGGSGSSSTVGAAIYAIDPDLRGVHTTESATRVITGVNGLGGSMTTWDADLDGAEDLVSRFHGGVLLFASPWVSDLTEDDRTAAWEQADGGHLGADLASLGDVTGDGAADLALFDQEHPGGAERAGRGYVVPGGDADGGSADDLEVQVRGEEVGDNMGRALASGDVDGDGDEDLIVGASGVHPGVWPGRVLVLPGPLSGVYTDEDAMFVVHGEYDGDYFGFSVASSDVDADGRADFVVGAEGWPAGASTGKVYLFLAADLPL